MKKILIPVLFLALAGCKTTKNDSSAILEPKYMNLISEDKLRADLTVVASDEMQGRETGSEGQKKAGKYLISQYQAAGIPFPKGATDYYQHIPATFLNAKRNEGLNDSENIWAFIEGSEKPDEIVVVSAHYDHVGVQNGEIYNGADDDGSGTVALLSIAQAFQKAKKDGHGPKRSILFLHITGEEHGLHGSRFYSENPLFPIANTVADVNIDMIGRRDDEHANTNNYIYVIGADRLSSELDQIVRSQNEAWVKLDLDFKFNERSDPNRFYFRSDHYNFAKNGIPSVFFFSGVHADYHKPGDEVEKIEFDALKKRAQLAFVTLWELANREQRIRVDKDGK
ncbi:M28 family metallopeptidase [Flavobacterium silvaticum]|uniref:M28 family peptidase n=1 Tax=Flavobacterium silvaticum TaxID=1852020 RepID=A0A972JGY1_9FLAO|nr:M28 family metallopeptidase [Flavobacterium silvaticum]NMH27360.1 M28 family peptidase [Flavobacterium silvaticum]